MEESESKPEDEDMVALFATLESDRKVITISYSHEEGMMNITHDRMSAYEALGLMITATDLLRHDISLIPALEDEEDYPEDES